MTTLKVAFLFLGMLKTLSKANDNEEHTLSTFQYSLVITLYTR